MNKNISIEEISSLGKFEFSEYQRHTTTNIFNNYGLFSDSLAPPIRGRVYAGLAEQLITIQPMDEGANAYYSITVSPIDDCEESFSGSEDFYI